MRAFVSIKVPCTERIDRCFNELNDAGIKTGSRSQLHITLKFLGDVDDRKIPHIVETLKKEAEMFPPFSIQLDRLGTFPRRDGSGIVWIGADCREASDLADRVDSAVSFLGIARETRTFKCHITAARVKKGIERADQLIGLRDFESLSVNSICLMKSTLTPRGPVYETIAEIPLKVES